MRGRGGGGRCEAAAGGGALRGDCGAVARRFLLAAQKSSPHARPLHLPPLLRFAHSASRHSHRGDTSATTTSHSPGTRDAPNGCFPPLPASLPRRLPPLPRRRPPPPPSPPPPSRASSPAAPSPPPSSSLPAPSGST